MIITKFPKGLPLKEVSEFLLKHYPITDICDTYCTLLLNRGVSIKTISRCAGHTTSAMTEKFYAHLKEETIIEEVAKIL